MIFSEQYICRVPVTLIMFNRPEQTEHIINALRAVKPVEVFVISDGPRMFNKEDVILVEKCRALIDQIDWDCTVFKNFSEKNEGCRRRVNSGLDWVFGITKETIIIEDDCLPTVDFFKFMEWGLLKYQNNSQIGMISGSNLIDFKFHTSHRNGFSRYINIWGWATWRRVWISHDKFLSINDLKKHRYRINKQNCFTFFESLYWNEIFKNTINSGSTWDFQLQHSFFRLNYLSVYPNNNLIENIGFGQNGTHTKTSTPEYIRKSKPKDDVDIMSATANVIIQVNNQRDRYLIKTIWYYSSFTAVRLWWTNLFRYLMI